MIKFIFTMIFYVAVARWIYAEVRLVTPQVMPAMDAVLTIAQIPTHDKWDPELTKQLLTVAGIQKPTAKGSKGQAIESEAEAQEL